MLKNLKQVRIGNESWDYGAEGVGLHSAFRVF